MKITSNLRLLALMLAVLTICGALFACKRPGDPTTDIGDTQNSNTTEDTGLNTSPSDTTSEESARTTTEPEPDIDLYALFKDLPQSYNSTPLWFWNKQIADMTEDMVRTIVRESYIQSGYAGFAILPEWQTDYLSEDYFNLYRAALDEGRKYGMKFVLYDEDGFPSYTAGGLFGEQYPEYTTKRLDMIDTVAKGGASVDLTLPYGTLMGAVLMNTKTFEMVDISKLAEIVINKTGENFDPDKTPVGVSASSTYQISAGYEADKAFDGNLNTRWNAASQSGGAQWLTVKFASAQTFDTIKLFEDADKQLQRTAKYTLQYWDRAASEWATLASGKTIGSAGVTHTFTAVTADIVRLYINQINGADATISEFQIYSGSTKLATPTLSEPVGGVGYSASSEYTSQSGYTVGMAFDGDFNTRWNAGTAQNQWVEVNFGSNRTVDNVWIYQHLDRIRGFKIQYWTGSAWADAYTGTTLKNFATAPTAASSGDNITFAAVNTARIRLSITSITGSDLPTLWELGFYNGATKLYPDGVGESTPDPNRSYLKYTLPGTAATEYRVMAFMCVRDNEQGMDYLSREAVAGYIAITHEAYYREFKEFFDDGTFTMAFFDEPSFWPAGGRTAYGAAGARFWTPKFNEEYSARIDSAVYNPVLDYPALFLDVGESTEAARVRMHGVRAELFAYNYVGQINEWCEAHGIKSTGHMLFEEMVNPVGPTGDLMLSFKYQSVPGIDLIDYYGFSQEAYKIISSSANNWDKGLVMSESFGVFRDTSTNDFYKAVMDQYTKGINLIIPHAVWYNATPNEYTYVPELSYRTPEYASKLKALNEYIGRGQLMLQDGRHIADIAVLYPIDTLEGAFKFSMTSLSSQNPDYADYMQVGELLSLSLRHDFTYLHPSVLDEKVSVKGNTLYLDNAVNYESYKIIIIPGMEVISLSNLRKIKEFYDNGGIVLGTTKLPTKGTSVGDNAEVIAMIKHIFGVDPTVEQPQQGIQYFADSIYGGSYSAAAAFDGVTGTMSRWNSATTEPPHWLEVRFPEATTVDNVRIVETYGRVNAFRLEYWDGSAYKTITTGTTIGTNKKITFNAVTTTRIRLYMTGTSGDKSFSIEEFEIYNGNSVNLALGGGGIRFSNTNGKGGRSYFVETNLVNNISSAINDAMAAHNDTLDVIFDNTTAKPNGTGNLSYIHKYKNSQNIFFVANSSGAAVNTTVTLRGHYNTLELWNPKTGGKSTASVQYKTVNGVEVTVVTLSLTAIGSVYIVEKK